MRDLEVLKLLAMLEVQHDESQRALHRVYMSGFAGVVTFIFSQRNFTRKTTDTYLKIHKSVVDLCCATAKSIIEAGHDYNLQTIDKMIGPITIFGNTDIINEMWKIRAHIVYSKKLWEKKFNIA